MANTFIFDDDEQQPDMGAPLPDQDGEEDQAPEEGEEGNNRLFMMLLIGIGVFVLIAILCVVGYFFMSRSGAASTNATATAGAATKGAQQTQEAQFTATLEPTAISTETATSTSVVIFGETPVNPQEPTTDPATQTLVAMQTQVASTATFNARMTASKTAAVTRGARTSTPQIPNTGFADEVGLPSLIVVTIVLLGVILLARRLRMAPGQ